MPEHGDACVKEAGVLHVGDRVGPTIMCVGCGVSWPADKVLRSLPLDEDNTVSDSGCPGCRKAARKRGW